MRGEQFCVAVLMNLSMTVYAWVFQFVEQMRFAVPEHVREAYAGYLGEALDETLGE